MINYLNHKHENLNHKTETAKTLHTLEDNIYLNENLFIHQHDIVGLVKYIRLGPTKLSKNLYSWLFIWSRSQIWILWENMIVVLFCYSENIYLQIFLLQFIYTLHRMRSLLNFSIPFAKYSKQESELYLWSMVYIRPCFRVDPK